LIGGYLFKYEDEYSDRPKGIPIPVESIVPSFVEDENVLLLKTIRKTYIFRGEDRAACISWIAAIEERKHLSIKEKMGHAPLSKDVVKSNKIGERLFDEKVKREGLEASRSDNMTMNPMIG
jgi:hypothetical protein